MNARSMGTDTTASPATRVLGVLGLAGLALLIPLGLLWTNPDRRQGDSVRLLYVHVPSAWLMYLGILIAVIGSVAWLWKRSEFWDVAAEAGAEIGLLFCVITLGTGMLWGRPTWGAYWVWDARLTTTAMLAVLLMGYLALRKTTLDPDARSRRSAWLGLALLPNAIIVHYAVDWWRGLHQTATVRPTGAEIEGLQLFTWMFGAVVFLVIFLWMMIHRFRIGWLTRQLDVKGLSVAVEQRRADASAHGVTS